MRDRRDGRSVGDRGARTGTIPLGIMNIRNGDQLSGLAAPSLISEKPCRFPERIPHRRFYHCKAMRHMIE